MNHGLLILSTLLLCAFTGPHKLPAVDSAQRMLAAAQRTPMLQVDDQLTGELMCWQAAYNSDQFLKAYEESNDTTYLAASENWCIAILSKRYTSPDGYKGWVGAATYDKKHKVADCHVGDAILCNAILDHCEVVFSSESLKKKFGTQAQAFLDDIEIHLFKKWQTRGTWWENGDYAGYLTFNKFLTPLNMTEFQTSPKIVDNIGYQMNKQIDMAIAHLRMSRITGDARHRQQAKKIFNFCKSRLCLFKDSYTWNYWEPFHPHDIYNGKDCLLWIATHPYRNYQKGEVKHMVEAFHSGLTFDETDIKRFVRTNTLMWNRKKEKDLIAFSNSNEAAVLAATGQALGFTPSKTYPTKAGCLWESLCEFDQSLAELRNKNAKNTEYKRKYDLPVEVYDVPFSDSANISMAITLPSTSVEGGYIQLASKFRRPDPVRISLCDDKGTTIKELFYEDHPGGNDGREGIFIRPWVIDVAAGTYRIRWQCGEEYRDARLWVTAKKQ